ncbi:hypothetical protein CBS147323_5947 [Aspergillus niger]|nr:hypothetical protein CBS147323_5947 [Aspergillus niger]KAI3031385.1 hypothetical protein CBS147347_2139 [Aspergillus niger]KAI3083193.1 hypothetical protein CBS147353_2217 [Aspergillus niger]
MDVQQLFNVKGKVVLVTGGAKGIGRMISEGFVKNGATVYISSRDAKSCDKAVNELNALGTGKAYAIPANFYQEEEVKRLAEEIAKRESKLHVLVNNSGSNWGAPYDEYPSSAWTRVLTLNLHRVFDLTKLLTPLLEKAGSSGDPARIINIGSIDGIRVPALETFAYSASKAGLHHLSRVLAHHLGRRNITSNSLACGPFESKMMAATLEAHRETIEGSIPLGRIGTPEDVAGACLFLSSRAGSPGSSLLQSLLSILMIGFMWKLQANFITLHYAYILFLGLLGLVVLYPYGNLRAIDAYFFGVSSSTESGLNTVDVKDMKLYQQLFIYFVPIVSNLGFINILVVVVRLLWFEKRLKEIAPGVLDRKSNPSSSNAARYDPEAHPRALSEPSTSENGPVDSTEKKEVDDGQRLVGSKIGHVVPERPRSTGNVRPENNNSDSHAAGISRSISFADTTKALYIPSPRERDRGVPIAEVQRGPGEDVIEEDDEDAETERRNSENTDELSENGRSATGGLPFERVASSLFVIGKQPSRAREPSLRPAISLSKDANLPELSVQATLGRNSQFHNLTAADRERLGGIEYRSLRLLLKIVIGYFVGLHVFGVVCLVPWILHSNRKYRDYLHECGQNEVWWAIYSAQTMTSNLGLTLTPDSMISFNNAVFPMLVMSFLAYAGNTLYPCCLRLIIWAMSKCTPESSSLKEPLEFLLKYPRRCYLLLFRSKPTWILFGIIFVLNFVDVLLILVLDLDNPAVNDLAPGPRVAAAIFQSASSRHTGTASFNLADVNPAVQFSLLVMMYISVFPIAISVRASNIYEERSIGVFSSETDMDEADGKRYVLMHMRNQLSFDLWYIFLGIMCICIAESGKIMDPTKPAFSVFAIFFEVVSAYGNVGLSLGYPTASTSFSAQFDIFSKIVICAMMIRGRHRGLPYQLDRAILIPNNRLVEDDKVETRPSISLPRIRSMDPTDSRYMKMKKAHTR